jgi:anti-sigma B factor antagonist
MPVQHEAKRNGRPAQELDRPDLSGRRGRGPDGGQGDPSGNGSRLRVSECQSRGISVVEFRDISLINDIALGDISRDLSRLIESGHRCLVLNFGNVMHLSSQLLGIVLGAHRRCLADGGMLKLCTIRAEVAEVFAITNLQNLLGIFPDEWAALESDWPEPSPRRPPTIPPAAGPEGREEDAALEDGTEAGAAGRTSADAPLAELREYPEPRPGPGRPGPAVADLEAPVLSADRRQDGDMPDRPARTSPGTVGWETTSHSAPPPPPTLSSLRVRLKVLVGRAQGKAVEVRVSRFFIGRDQSCHLRAHSLTVSRFHALIERRGGRVFLRDLGSSNGTILGQRTLQKNEEAEVSDGERLQIGPMLFTVTIEPARATAPEPLAAASGRVPGLEGHIGDEAHEHPLPWILCPKCGTEGWIPMERLLRELVHAIGQAWPPAAPRVPGPQARAPSDASSHDLSPAVSVVPSPVASWGEGDPELATLRDIPTFELLGTAAGTPPPEVAPPASAAPPPPDLADFEIPALPDGPTAELPGTAGEGETPRARVAPDRPVPAVVAPSKEAASPADPPTLLNLPTFDFPEALPQREGPGAPEPSGRQTTSRLALKLLCPECGVEIRAPVSQLGQRLLCKECGSELFLHSDGELVADDPPAMPRAGENPRLSDPRAR